MPVPAGEKKKKRVYPVSPSRQGTLFNCHIGHVYYSAAIVEQLQRLFNAGIGVHTAAKNIGVPYGQNMSKLWADFEQKEWVRIQETGKQQKRLGQDYFK